MLTIRKRIVFKIEEETLQSEAKANIGRELTEIEIKRICCLAIDDDYFYTTVLRELLSIIEQATESDRWEEYDKRVTDMTIEDLMR